MTRSNIALYGTIMLLAAIYCGCASTAEPPAQTNANRAENRTVAVKSPEPSRTPVEAVPPVSGPDAETAPNSVAGGSLSRANYEKIKEGMTLGEVEKILGGEGLKVSTMTVNGRETEIYKWTNDNFKSYIDVVFEKNKVVEKKEKGIN
jgi:hypothetical protein